MFEMIITKICRICKTDKLINEYYKNSKTTDGFFHECKECHANNGKKWRIRNKDHISKKRRKRYLSNKEKNHEYGKKWRKKNLQHVKLYRHKIYIKNKERHNYLAFLWRKNNHFRIRAIWTNAKIKKEGGEGKLTGKDIQEIYEKQKGLCNACKIDVSKKFNIDHVIPISKGGINLKSNIQILCVSCNSSKADKDYNEFLLAKGFASNKQAN